MSDTTMLTACASCGADVPAGARYCPRCGADAPTRAAPKPVAATARPPKPTRTRKPPRTAPAAVVTAPVSADVLAPWPGGATVVAAASRMPVSPPAPVAEQLPPVPPIPPRGEPRAARAPQGERRRRGPEVLPIAMVVVLVLLIGTVAYLLTRPSTGPSAASAAHVSAKPVATVPSSPAATAAPVPSTTPTAAAAPLTTALSRAQLKALFLTNKDLAGATVQVRSGGQSDDFTLSAYSDRNQSETDPASCRNAKGLMFFSDTDTPSSAGWNRRTIARRNDLALAGSSLVGDQQLRQFATVQAAQQFMQEQRIWFSNCSDVAYGTDNPVEYHGTVDDQSSPDLLLTSATHSGADSNVEFDGWTRVGTVVYAAYLLGDGSTSVQDVRAGGRSVLVAAERRLQQTR